MTKKPHYFGKKYLNAVFAGALALSIFPSAARAAAENRFWCIAKTAGKYFTDGSVIMKEYPCKVNPDAVDRLVKAKAVDIRTDQISYDYLWYQEYFTNGYLLTDVRPMTGGPAPIAPPAAAEITVKDTTSESPADLLLSTGTPLGPEEPVKETPPKPRHKTTLIAGVGIEGPLPVLSLGLRVGEWTGAVFFGLGEIKHGPQAAFTRTAADSFGNYDQISDSREFDSTVKRTGLEFSKSVRPKWNFLGGFRYDRITESYNGRRNVNTFDGGGILTGASASSSSGRETIGIVYATLGLGYELSSIVGLNARILVPLGSKRSAFGNKYGKTALGADITIELL